MTEAPDVLVNLDVAWAMAPHTVNQARRSMLLQVSILVALVTGWRAWTVLPGPQPSFLLLLALIGLVPAIRNARWKFFIRWPLTGSRR